MECCACLLALARAPSSRLASGRKSTHTHAAAVPALRSLCIHSLCTRHYSTAALTAHATGQLPPATLYLLSACGAALGVSGWLQRRFSPPPEWIRRPRAAGQTITAYSACNRARHRLCYDSHSPPPAAARDAANATTINRMHDLFQSETLLPGVGAPSDAKQHLRLAADDRLHRGQCILNRATIATSSVRRAT